MQQANEAKENLWSSLLDSVSSGRRLPDKQLLVAGGTPELQKDLLETLDSDSPKRPQDARRKRPPISNEFALGYTYQEVLDADHEDILARLSIYTLQEPIPAFTPLVKSLLTPQTIPSSLVVILLDWSEPWKWIRQIRDWILFLQSVIASLDAEASAAIQQKLQEPGSQGAPGAEAGDGSSGQADAAIVVPRGPGESDEALGLPISFVCHNSNKIETLEKEYSWREEEFDYLLQFLRTVLLKYGASLIYTSNTSPNSLPLLVQTSLSVHSSLKRETLKHNVVDRESILIPPNWDSWGKIRVIREGFDVEGISSAWSDAVQAANVAFHANGRPSENGTEPAPHLSGKLVNEPNWTTILQAFDEAITDPTPAGAPLTTHTASAQVQASNMQEFLSQQAQHLEQLRLEEERMQTSSGTDRGRADDSDAPSRVNEHIGPVKFNMGGIQVDAEDMLNSLRHREETPARETEPAVGKETGIGTGTATPEGGKNPGQQNEALASFFAGLIKKGGRGDSPKPQARS